MDVLPLLNAPSWVRVVVLLFTCQPIWAGPVTDQGDPILTAQQFLGIEANVQSIKNILHEDEIVLGIGRSPTPFMAYFQEVLKWPAFNIPLTNARSFGAVHRRFFVEKEFSDINMDNLLTINPLGPDQRERIHRMLDDYLPWDLLRKNKPVAILDYSRTGLYLLGVSEIIEYYLREKGFTNTVRTICITAPQYNRRHTIDYHAKKWGRELDVVHLDSRIGAFFSSKAMFAKMSEFGQFDLARAVSHPPKQSSEGFLALKKMIRFYYNNNLNKPSACSHLLGG